jgi:hypothetical protein
MVAGVDALVVLVASANREQGYQAAAAAGMGSLVGNGVTRHTGEVRGCACGSANTAC